MTGRVFDKARYHHAQLGPGVSSEQAYVHGGLLYVWLARRALLEAELRERVETSLGAGEKVSEIYAALADGVLVEEDLTATGAAFLSAYLPEENGHLLGVSVSFWEDIEELEGKTGGPYTTPNDGASAERFAARFDQRFAEWRAAGSPAAKDPPSNPRAPDERFPALPASGAVSVVLLGVPGPWPAWNRLTVWRPDTAEQREATRRVRGEWVGFVPTEDPTVPEPEVGRIGALVWVEKVMPDGRIWMALPSLARFAVLGQGADGEATVALLRDAPASPGAEADRAAWLRIQTTGDLRELIGATDPLARVELAQRLTQR